MGEAAAAEACAYTAVRIKSSLLRVRLGSYVVAPLPTQSGGSAAVEYAIALVYRVDAAAQTCDLLHTPNDADRAVLDAQRQRQQPPPTPDSADRAVLEFAIALASDPPAAEAGTDVAAAPSDGLTARVFRRVPMAHVAPYPGKSMTLQYKKGQEVLVRWETSVEITEPTPHCDLRPRKVWRSSKWSTMCYPAEVVGGPDVEHLSVRFLHASDPDAEHTVHKRDVALAPDKGEPDEAERKRQRKARKKRDEERKKREELKQAEGSGPTPPADPSHPALPVLLPTGLAATTCPGIVAATAARQDIDADRRSRTPPPLKSPIGQAAPLPSTPAAGSTPADGEAGVSACQTQIDSPYRASVHFAPSAEMAMPWPTRYESY